MIKHTEMGCWQPDDDKGRPWKPLDFIDGMPVFGFLLGAVAIAAVTMLWLWGIPIAYDALNAMGWV